MAESYLIRHETLDGIAEAIKSRRGRDEGIYVEEMAYEILNISNAELPELTNPGNAEDLLAGKQMIDETGAVVTGTYSGGTDTSDATATANEIFSGETAYTANGKITGTFTIDSELTEQNDLIEQISTLVATKANPQGGTDTSDATATAADILSGKTAYVKGSKVTGNIATVTQATPSVSINSSGLITASATQTAGYVAAGTKSGTKQITTQAAKTITPTTTAQTAVASGRYTTGAITVAGDANLKAENIAEGVSIFGVTGTHSGGGGSSSGGGFESNTDTCEIAISSDYQTEAVCYYGADGHTVFNEYASKYNINAICGSVVYVVQSGYYSANVSAGEIIFEQYGNGFVYRVPSTPPIIPITINITTD